MIFSLKQDDWEPIASARSRALPASRYRLDLCDFPTCEHAVKVSRDRIGCRPKRLIGDVAIPRGHSPETMPKETCDGVLGVA